MSRVNVKLASVPLPTKGAKLLPLVEKVNSFFTVKGRKFKFSAQEKDLAPFVGNGTKVKIPSEIKPPLVKTQTYKFIIQHHKNVYPKPNVKISMHATKHYKLHVILVTVTARRFTKHKRKAIVIRLLNIKTELVIET